MSDRTKVKTKGKRKGRLPAAKPTKDPSFTIRAHPSCSLCSTPFVLRRAMLWTPGKPGKTSPSLAPGFVWQRDCKHTKSPAKAVQCA